MEKIRNPFEGIWNIVRFNWHFYVLSFIVVCVLAIAKTNMPHSLQWLAVIICIYTVAVTCISLLVSFYIYDLAGLYNLSWLEQTGIKTTGNLVNIHAGFDETSHIIQQKYQPKTLTVFDFYDPQKHTELSIKRARKTYPPFPETLPVQTLHLPLANGFADTIFLIFAAHEIRDNEERIIFFKELNRTLDAGGNIVVTEHLRNLPNFLAYNFGFFHFLSRRVWYSTFKNADLCIKQEIKITPFITTFILCKNGNTA